MDGWMMRRWLAGVALAGLGLVTAGCGGANNFVPPTGATPIPVTETFTDTLQPNGAFTYPFVAQSSGSIQVTLTAVDPDVALGVSLGTWNGLTCQAVIANDKAAIGVAVIGTATAIGNFCARVYDVGTVTGPTSFTLSVLRP